MTRLIVGLGDRPAPRSTSQIGCDDAPGGHDAGERTTVQLGAHGAIELVSQGLESDGVHWYAAELDDDADVDGVLAALQERDGVDAAYVQAPEGPPTDGPPG